MGERYLVSSDGESYCGDFPAREDAIASAADELGLEPGAAFWVGKGIPLTAERLAEFADFDRVLDDITDNLSCDLGCDELMGAAPLKSRAEFRECVAGLLAKYGLVPDWSAVDDATEHVASSPGEAVGQNG